MNTKAGRKSTMVFFVLLTLVTVIPAYSQETGNSAVPGKDTSIASQATSGKESPIQFTAGKNALVEGVIVKRSADSFTMRDLNGGVVEVTISSSTDVKERKSNPFRRAKGYGITQLVSGLEVEVKGHGSSSGALVADEIRFTQDDLRFAAVMDARVNPVETRLATNENRLSQNEENALRLSGQVSELSAVSNAARGGAKAAQETADGAMESAKAANEEAKNAKAGVRATNERIAALDDFDTKSTSTVNFTAGSATLSTASKAELDKIAETAKNEKGYVIEVAGFASSDGDQTFNQALSQKRADAVIRYMVENHSIPLRRFITPFGYGEKMPVADNKTRDGRIQNRRVEVRVLVSKGLAQSGLQSVAMN
jgi:outer membrane protein OmpA-like peptidoglycan-associated protein